MQTASHSTQDFQSDRKRRVSMEISSPTMRFPLGQVVATSALVHELSELLPVEEIQRQFLLCLARHVAGDWGDVCSQDARANEQAVKIGARILSSYNISSVKIWIITDADRISTCIMRPDDY